MTDIPISSIDQLYQDYNHRNMDCFDFCETAILLCLNGWATVAVCGVMEGSIDFHAYAPREVLGNRKEAELMCEWIWFKYYDHTLTLAELNEYLSLLELLR